MQRKRTPRRSQPTFSPHIPPVAPSADAPDVPLKAIKTVERLQGVLDHAKAVKKAEKSKR